MAEKKAQIVIKKITIVAGGAHGGAWKVAFADFMTAMMAFFLVMWLVNSTTAEEKKAISDYFSTPSIIEYQFNNYGVELTLEKLFVDLVNEPLKVFQSFVTPMDRTPNVMAMGMKKVVAAHLTEQLGEVATGMDITSDQIVFEIPDSVLFERGSANPTAKFTEVMEKLKGVTTGLEDSDIFLTSVVSIPSVSDKQPRTAKNVSEARLDMVDAKVRGSLENDSVEVHGKALVRDDDGGVHEKKGRAGGGYIRVEIRQKRAAAPTGKKTANAGEAQFGAADKDKSVYDNFVNQVSKKKRRDGSKPAGDDSEAH